jgi:hypothetical protein
VVSNTCPILLLYIRLDPVQGQTETRRSRLRLAQDIDYWFRKDDANDANEYNGTCQMLKNLNVNYNTKFRAWYVTHIYTREEKNIQGTKISSTVVIYSHVHAGN